RELISAIKDYAKQSVLYISATGSGKSIAFTLPALIYKDGIVIVIQLIYTLQQDISRRLNTLTIDN
ncbi:hypothetical protein QBC39DRAFT_269851, partial [Podospora conica]